jgi:hypothetical protein
VSPPQTATPKKAIVVEERKAVERSRSFLIRTKCTRYFCYKYYSVGEDGYFFDQIHY